MLRMKMSTGAAVWETRHSDTVITVSNVSRYGSPDVYVPTIWRKRDRHMIYLNSRDQDGYIFRNFSVLLHHEDRFNGHVQ